MKVHELLTDASKWTQFTFARRADGLWTSSGDELAICWCLQGAINRCYDLNARHDVRSRIRGEVGDAIGPWNDAEERTFEQVRELVTRLGI